MSTASLIRVPWEIHRSPPGALLPRVILITVAEALPP